MTDSPGAQEFDPTPVLAVLERHGVEYVLVGGYAARVHGSARPTQDVDVTPATTLANLIRLAAALAELDARIRTEGEPAGVPFAASADSLAGIRTLNLQTPLGALDLTFQPDGTAGYDDLNRNAVLHPVGGVQVRVAALADVIRSKEAAGRAKDLRALPELYELAGSRPDPDLPVPAWHAPRPPGQPTAAERIDAAREAARRRRDKGT